jgi:exodeoxyribonuclease V beta subunit
MQPFDVLHCSLDGAKLVEASAGTGKTFAIAALYLRLVLERGLRPPQILVVTYTEAATKELRDRIRSRLREAHQAFLAPDTAGADELVRALLAGTADRPRAIRRLSRALSDFDQAAVFTIHGFCQRTLQENAFESGNLFDTELVTEQDDLKLEIVEDFWRRHFYQAPPFLVYRALEQGYSPGVLMKLVRTSAIQPDIRVLPELQPRPREEIESDFAAVSSAIQSLQQQWPPVRDKVAELLRSRALNATMYGSFKPGSRGDETTARDDKINRLLGDLERYLEVFDPAYPFPLPEKFELLTATKLQKATKAKEITPNHAVFVVCDAILAGARRLLAALDEHLLYLKTELFRALQAELPVRKLQKNIQHFDDLLLKLREALDQPGGAALAAVVRSRYEAALIDEFQDTDPIQYDIFRKLFAASGRSLLLIGDPKQAIYSFRGADVFAYLEAARDIPDQFTLGTNWRSEPALIQAVNTVFEGRPDPFVFPEIGFQAVAAPQDKALQPLTLDGQPFEPLRFWHVSADTAVIERAAAKDRSADGSDLSSPPSRGANAVELDPSVRAGIKPAPTSSVVSCCRGGVHPRPR